jgi:hypothetical protein
MHLNELDRLTLRRAPRYSYGFACVSASIQITPSIYRKRGLSSAELRDIHRPLPNRSADRIALLKSAMRQESGSVVGAPENLVKCAFIETNP